MCMHDKERLKLAPGHPSSHNGCRNAKENGAGGARTVMLFEKVPNVSSVGQHSAAVKQSPHIITHYGP